MTRSKRKMSVSARPVRCSVYTHRPVQGGCTVWTRNPEKRQLQINNYDFSVVGNLQKKNQDCGQAFLLMVTTSDLSSEAELTSFLVLVSASLSPRAVVVSFHHFQTTHRLASCADATSANSESMETNSTRMLVTSWKRMVAVNVLLRNTQPNQCLATQGTFAVND